MVTIYCIEDCNSLKYVGSTKKKINRRFSKHKSNKKRNHDCSSSKLDLDNSKIYSLETCNESNRSERERYWINKLDCVNSYKLNKSDKEHIKEYQREYHKGWRDNNKEHIKEYKKEFNKEYYLFNSKKVVNGCYEFINMLNEY